jgi:RsiW-degrading membrane proteinase PrsW (M82 family)
MHPGNLGSALVFAVVPALILLGAIYWLDRYEKEPSRLLAIALFFGAILAPVVAFVIQKIAGVPTSMAAQSTVPRSRLSPWTPLIEELARGGAILAVVMLVRSELDDLLDGLVYGAVVGVGFGLAANFVAILTTHPLPGGDASASLFTTAVSGLNHVFYGALIGVIVAAARRLGTGALAGAAALGIAAAYGFHIVHDYLPWWLSTPASSASSSHAAGIISEIPNYFGLAALAVLAAWTLYREGEVVGRELHGEVGTSITAEEYDIVTNPFKRFATMFKALYTGGNDFGLRRRLYSQAVDLAFRKHHRETDKLQARDLLDEDVYRHNMAETRARLNTVLEAAARRGSTPAPGGGGAAS